jgi:hypothetical protein
MALIPSSNLYFRSQIVDCFDILESYKFNYILYIFRCMVNNKYKNIKIIYIFISSMGSLSIELDQIPNHTSIDIELQYQNHCLGAAGLSAHSFMR